MLRLRTGASDQFSPSGTIVDTVGKSRQEVYAARSGRKGVEHASIVHIIEAGSGLTGVLCVKHDVAVLNETGSTPPIQGYTNQEHLEEEKQGDDRKLESTYN
jgi:hypothetical protein